MKTQYERNLPYEYLYRGEVHSFNTPGRYRHKYINQLRYPKTYNEIRANSRDKEYVRGKRSPANIATSWWDIRPSYHFGSNWKRFTKNKHQWQH